VSGPGAGDEVAAALARTHEWFAHHSGWAPPDEGTLVEWLADGVCRAPDDCLVTPTTTCPHGLASWWLVLRDLGDVPALTADDGTGKPGAGEPPV
jgi:hypothetical protein